MDVDILAQLLAQAHTAGLIRPAEEINTLVQKAATPAATTATAAKAKAAAMSKYLKIA